MPPLFFQKFWHIIHSDVVDCVLRILNDKILLHKLNFTHIVCIPKCKKPETVAHFRPISLSNVIMRIASKCVANRLKFLLDDIISVSQSAFIPGRLITDNVLVAFEINKWVKTKTRGKAGSIALKLDMSKAYDRVEWNFLERVLHRIVIHEGCIRLIMLLVTSVSYSLMLNGKQFGYFTPRRGLRQGDPLSPYLFLFIAETFSSMLQRAEEQHHIQGIAVARGAPKVSHLLFVDDTIIFSQATEGAMRTIRDILELYAGASGQVINLEKSSMVISRNVEAPRRMQLAQQLGVQIVDKHEKYLGLPVIASKSRTELF
ncbi:UNVERIFIED_CONTAM: Retrovirus-related Pol polyprotein from type-1 retrotransposable element R2 [Sesamum radiatum]|uniref:Retrovirus-related Pol polyprotein from type-1 retrotransposable element R2 n=1 Tax=Sesamum radiatum TaxID=300843 RepID=A0AAW2TYT9_SESRA